MNNNKIVLGAVLALVIVIGVVVLMTNNNTGTNTKNVDTSRVNPEPNNASNEETSVPAQEANQITYKNFTVSPSVLTVKKGTTVTWVNQDDSEHTVTPDSETADFQESEPFGKGETYKVTFNEAGTYSYHCLPHPDMKGTIEVTE